MRTSKPMRFKKTTVKDSAFKIEDDDNDRSGGLKTGSKPRIFSGLQAVPEIQNIQPQ